jgi:hypothetical protein
MSTGLPVAAAQPCAPPAFDAQPSDIAVMSRIAAILRMK